MQLRMEMDIAMKKIEQKPYITKFKILMSCGKTSAINTPKSSTQMAITMKILSFRNLIVDFMLGSYKSSFLSSLET
jgi:hypothetical protein